MMSDERKRILFYPQITQIYTDENKQNQNSHKEAQKAQKERPSFL